MAKYNADYVIIGGGTAGLVLASRLTEDPTIRVIVLEAGENRSNDPRINVPAFAITLYGDANYDWDFKTTSQKDLNDRVFTWPRGKVLGGSSAINFLFHTHASRVDLDNWEKLGNRGWNFDTLQPYYRKSETYNASSSDEVTPGTDIIDPSLHGQAGPIQTSFPRRTGALAHAWDSTLTNLGLGVEGQDPRAGATLGGYSVLMSMDKNARRSSAAQAYLSPAADRSNLTVLTNVHVNKILFASTGPPFVATGVVYTVGEEEFFVEAKNEVIVCAGSINSPQILELSGIGSEDILHEFGVDVLVSNRHVGENLQDHLLVSVSYEALDGVPTAEMLKMPGVLDLALQEWAENGTGPLSRVATGTAFLSYASVVPAEVRMKKIHQLANLLEQANQPTDNLPALTKQLQLQKEQLLNDTEADIQFNFGATGVNTSSTNDISKMFTHTDPGGYAGIAVASTHPFSRGSIHIQSPDAKVYPIINPCYFSHPIDMELMTAGVLFTQKIAATKPLADFLKDNSSGNGKITQPGFNIREEGLTEARAAEIVKEYTITSFHPVGTCSMLPEEDGGVVSPTLKVYGTQNVRVVDASIIPLHVRGNIASLVYAIAEKAADLIKSEHTFAG